MMFISHSLVQMGDDESNVATIGLEHEAIHVGACRPLSVSIQFINEQWFLPLYLTMKRSFGPHSNSQVSVFIVVHQGRTGRHCLVHQKVLLRQQIPQRL